MVAWRNESYSLFLLLLSYSGASNIWMVRRIRAPALNRTCATASTANLNLFLLDRLFQYVFTLRAFEEEEEKEGGNASSNWLATALPEVIGAAVQYRKLLIARVNRSSSSAAPRIRRTAKLCLRALNFRPCPNNTHRIFYIITLFFCVFSFSL